MKKILIGCLCSFVLFNNIQACQEMAHWANVRNEEGEIVEVIDEGAEIEIIGPCSYDYSRTLIYDYSTGTYGTVSSVYIYGGTDYEYCNPTEYCKNGYDETTPWAADNLDYCYDETTPWAADNLDYYYNEYEEDEYEYEYEEDEYEYEEDDSFIFYNDDEIWVDVNIDSQIVNVYNGAKIILSGYCVTGMCGVSDTPCGQFRIFGKERNTTLIGDDYACDVDFWMPFTESGCGFHDSSWRSDYGNDIYLTNGSHGCVNLEYNFVEQMYEMIPEDGCYVNIH